MFNNIIERLNDIIDIMIQDGYKIIPHITEVNIFGRKPSFRIDLEIIIQNNQTATKQK